MTTCTTNGITVTIRVQYLPEHSNPLGQKFIFGYHIKIENGAAHTIQLTHRHWTIIDSNGSVRRVDGEGVVGRQPIMPSGASHEYVSFCNLFSEMGRMGGHYVMHNVDTDEVFQVEIPEFLLVSPFKLN